MRAALIAAAVAFAAAAPAYSQTVVIDPTAGGSGSFQWNNGLGSIDQIDGINAQDSATFGLTAASGGTVDAWLNDCCVAGDQFALVLNGTTLAATTTTVSGGVFSYFFDDIVLAVGANTFGVTVTGLAPGHLSGGASYSFSAVTSAVPEPGTWAMLLLGFGAIGHAMRRNRKSKPRLQLA